MTLSCAIFNELKFLCRLQILTKLVYNGIFNLTALRVCIVISIVESFLLCPSMLLLGRVSSIFHHIWVTEEKDFDCHSSQAHCYTKRPPLKFSKLIGIVVEWDKYLLWKACCVLRIIFRTKSKSLFAQLAIRHRVAPCLYKNVLL